MSPHQPGLSVLLVEDDAAHAEITRRNIEELAPLIREIVHMSDGQAALDHLRRGQAGASGLLPDLILLDLRLPRVDGLEVLEQVKADLELKLIPVVVLTTSSADDDVRRAYARGANSYLVKPFEPDEFLKLTRAMGHYWLRLNRTVSV
jgi:CheY-like chemotaxis protein